MLELNRSGNANFNCDTVGFSSIGTISDTVNFIPSVVRPITAMNLHNVRNLIIQCDVSNGSTATNTNLDKNLNVPINIIVYSSGNTLTLQKSDILCHLILPPNTKINVKLDFNSSSYSLKNSSSEKLVIKNIISFINTCVFLDKLNTCISLNTDLPYPEPIEIKLDEVTYLRAYEKIDKKLIGLFAKQNNINIFFKKIDLFIKENFFELSGIAHTNSTIFPQEILEEICSHLKLSDINLNHVEDHIPLLADSYDL